MMPDPTRRPLNVLGLSCHYHDAAACLMCDGQIAAAAQEERFTRRKHCSDFPRHAIHYCLQAADLTIRDVDAIAFYEKPYAKFERVVLDHVRAWPWSLRNFMLSMPDWVAQRLSLPVDIKEDLCFEGPILFIPHHLSHAASAFLVSPFEEAATLTADGIGEWTTTTFGVGRGCRLELLKQQRYPHSLGLLYSAMTAYLGFAANGGEGKTMALSDFGEPAMLDRFQQIVSVKEDGSFRLDESYFGFIKGRRMYGPKLLRLFGPERKPGEPITQRHRDIAASLQKLVERILVAAARHVQRATEMKRLCLSGGVFLNCVANSRILEETPFEELYVQPGAGDAGGSLGAAAYVVHCLNGRPRQRAMRSACLGPEFPGSHPAPSDEPRSGLSGAGELGPGPLRRRTDRRRQGGGLVSRPHGIRAARSRGQKYSGRPAIRT